MIADLGDSAVAAIDLQPSFLAGISKREAVVARSRFLLECARVLEVPAIGTEQYSQRMGATEPSVATLLAEPANDKLCFSAGGCEGFMRALEATGRRMVVVVGIETHICVAQTSLDLLERGFTVLVCADAVGARSTEAHEIGLRRLGEAGCIVTHTESVVYEWMRSAEHPKFREVLRLVKES